MNRGIKHDEGKLRWDLSFRYAFEDIIKVTTYGAKKYGDRNWEAGISWLRVWAAVMRHLWAWFRGEDVDQESGQPHLAHAGWGICALLDYSRTHPEFDDRMKE